MLRFFTLLFCVFLFSIMCVWADNDSRLKNAQETVSIEASVDFEEAFYFPPFTSPDTDLAHHECSCYTVFGGSKAMCPDRAGCTCSTGLFQCECTCDWGPDPEH